MELQHRFTVPASVDETWAMFNDLERVAPCFPGAALTSAEGDDFAGTVKVKLGPVSLQYSGTGSFVERDESTHTARFEAKGKDRRGNGTAAAKVRAVLTPDAGGVGTGVEVSTDLTVTGKPAQFGRGLMQDVSDKLLDRFVDCLTERLTTPAVAEPAPDVAVAAPAEAAAGPAAAPPPRVDPGPRAEPAPRADPPPRVDPPPAAELDLGATVLPVLARRYGPYVAGGVCLVAVGYLLGRLPGR